MILADTSIWVDHLRSGNKEMRKLLNQRQIVMHPFITAELALGSLRDRTEVLALLDLIFDKSRRATCDAGIGCPRVEMGEHGRSCVQR